jgi:nucleoside 2-deoxyribosyltransferase
MIYLIGSLRNPAVPDVARTLRAAGFEVFNDWHSAGPDADDHLRDHYRERGHSYEETLHSKAALHIFEFDLMWLDACDAAVMMMPAGKSAHLELGYVIGQGKPGYILMDGEPERVDVMHNFADGVFTNIEDLISEMKLKGLK